MRWLVLVRAVLITAVMTGLAACGGGGGGSGSPPNNPPADPPPTPPVVRTNWDAALWDTDKWS
ncbi:hypothetical protein GCM10011488_25510 [Steroidobacter agaridevorans]|nr:hypothetical protein GCM10011488_25510 [Steroidobacter agaridevorans]